MLINSAILIVSNQGVSLLTAIKPTNQDSEKERFMRANFHYNPQFLYQYEIPTNLLAKFDTPSDRYLTQVSVVYCRILEPRNSASAYNKSHQ